MQGMAVCIVLWRGGIESTGAHLRRTGDGFYPGILKCQQEYGRTEKT